MREDSERDPVEDALLRMGQFDEHEAAIERAESEGIVAEVPELSSAKLDAIVAASLLAAAPESEVEHTSSATSSAPSSAPSSARSWLPWAAAVAVAIAAALVLWQAPASQDDSASGLPPLPSAHQLRLGGTARTLGDTPAIRSYGPGDAFFVELPFDAPIHSDIVAELFARDSAGALQPVPLARQQRDDAVLFEGEIAQLLSPGVWTLQVRYGDSHTCSASTPDGCETRETRIEVVGP